MVDAVLAEAGISLAMLDGIAASIGPGAFTGVRISVAVAQGLCFGADLPVVPVTTLEALALQAMQQRGGPRACVPGCAHGRGVLGLLRRRCGARPASPAARLGWGRPRRCNSRATCAELAASAADLPPIPNSRRSPGLERVQAGCLAGCARDGADRRVRLSAGEGMDPADLRPQYLRDKVALTGEERAAQGRASRALERQRIQARVTQLSHTATVIAGFKNQGTSRIT